MATAATADEVEHEDSREAAREAGLRYVSDAMPGIRRRRSGQGWAHLDAGGRRIRDAATLGRIKALAVPPAWTDVWICPAANGHLQATGRDARGRKQYRYHARWREVRDEAKYERLLPFGLALPRVRARVRRDLRRRGMPREKVLAAIVRLLDRALVRVGNQEYTRDNGSYGLTTLLDDQINVTADRLVLRFRGKSGRKHLVGLRDKRLARVARKLQDLPGQELFQYIDEEGEVRRVTSEDVNDYLRDTTGQEFSAKDFRTWAGTVLGLHALTELEVPASQGDRRRKLNEAVKSVATILGNTPAVCRKCYLHSSVIDAYLDGELDKARARSLPQLLGDVDSGLRAEERAVIRFLRRRRS